MDLKLRGRHALITGATGGIGMATATRLLQEGVEVSISGRDAEKLRRIGGELAGMNLGQVHVLPADLANPDEVEGLVSSAVEVMKGLDIVVSSAGGAKRGLLEEHADADWLERLLVKPLGVIRLARASASHLRRSDAGRFIIVGGGHGREPTDWAIMGGTINASVMAFAKGLSLDFARDGATVNIVNPGHTKTARWDEVISRTVEETGLLPKDAERVALAKVPLGRVIEPDEVASAIAFLASELAAGITGSSIDVDGGRRRSI